MYLDDKTTKKQAFDFAKGTDAARHHFVSEIERINTEIARLREGSNNSPRGDMELRVTKLHEETKSLRDQLKALSENVSLEQALPDETADESLDASLTEEEREQQIKGRVEEQLAVFDNAARVEAVDQQWAATARADVLESFQALSEEGVGVSDVQCHTSFCQGRFYLDNDDINASVRELQAVSPWKGETFIWIENTEQGEGVIYLARDGYKLPHNSYASDSGR